MGKYKYEEVKNYIEIESKSNCKLLSQSYKDCRSPLLLHCQCGIEFITSFNNFKHKHKHCCNKCAKIKRGLKRRIPFKFAVGEVIKLKGRDAKILDCIRDKSHRYKYQCLVCNHIDIITSNDAIKRKIGCPVCSNKKVKIGYNDMWTTNPELAKLLTNPEDGYKYTQHSSTAVDWRCPDCGETVKNRKISDICNRKLLCHKCSDGISYPEKFIYNLLKQLDVEFVTQLTRTYFKWCKNYRYDFYIPSLNLILEVHGLQHYENSKFKRTLLEEKENDILKEQLARYNGILKYIVIDARESELEWIKNSILHSELTQLFDLSSINWSKCHESGCCNLVKTVCKLWNDKVNNIMQIGIDLNISRDSVIKYLKQGTTIGLCHYDPVKEQLKGRKNATIASTAKCSKAVVQINKDTLEFIREYTSAEEAYRQTKINHISACCLNKLKQAGGFKWMFAKDYKIISGGTYQ